MKLSITINPHRLTPEAKDAQLSSGIDAESLAEGLEYAARLLKDQPERRSVIVIVERTDV